MNARLQDLTGVQFERWTVVARGASRKNLVHWVCRCVCGTERSVSRGNLKSGKSRSCGCLQQERASETFTKHNMSNHPIYGSWASIKDRCTNQNSEDFHHYGGRGISIYQPWVDDFWNFWDGVASGWRPGLSIDRIEVNGNYEPGNIRWADQKTQCRNRRNTIFIDTPWGPMRLVEAAERSGIGPRKIRDRIARGFTMERIFETDSGRRT